MDYKELIALSQKAANEWRNDHTFYQAGTLIDSLCSAIETLLAEQDATNVAPVVHGRWIMDGKEHCYCSECKHGRNIRSQIGWVYCPNCGAKMG